MSWSIRKNGVDVKLTLKRKGFFEKKELWLGEELLGHWPGVSELMKGASIRTKDGSELKLKMRNFPNNGLDITFNGEPVRGASNDPATQAKIAYGVMALVCGLNLLMGLAVIFSQSSMLSGLGYGTYNLIFGSLFLVLVISGFKSKAFWPLTIGLMLFLIDTLFMIQQLVALKMAVNVGPYIVRILLIVAWSKGVMALWKQRIGK